MRCANCKALRSWSSTKASSRVSRKSWPRIVLEIITVFSARLYGSHSHQSKRLLDALVNDGGQTVVETARQLSILGSVKRAPRITLKPPPEQESLFGQYAGYALNA